MKVNREEELISLFKREEDGPLFIHVMLKLGNTNVPNITITTEGIKERFMGAL